MEKTRRRVAVNTAYLPFLQDSTRLQIFFGGSSSGKSYFVAQRVVLDVLAGRNYLVCRDVARTLRQSVYNQVAKSIDELGLRGHFALTKSEMTITCRKNGRQILFAGLDDTEKLKSVTPARGVLTDVWLEEATEVSYEAYKQITKRLRGRCVTAQDSEGRRVTPQNGTEQAKRITFSFNPITKEHWIYKEFFGGWVDGDKAVQREDGLLVVKTTYRDNAFLTADDRAALENESDRYYYEVYTLGQWGVLGKVIFKNWELRDLSADIPRYDKIYNGLDFGFSEDPNALVRVQVDMAAKTLYVFEELYKAGMHDDELAGELQARLGGQYVTCDCAEPKAISDLCRRGIRAIPALKGPDSVNFGIRFLQGFRIVIHTACRHFRSEIAVYHWAEDKYGNALRRPVDRDNHLLDALRYALEEVMHQAAGGAARRI